MFTVPSLPKLIVLFGIIIAVSLLAFVSIQRLVAASVHVQQSQTLLIEIDHFLSDLKDVETGGRGSALSGGDELCHPRAINHVRVHEGRLWTAGVSRAERASYAGAWEHMFAHDGDASAPNKGCNTAAETARRPKAL